MPLLVATLGVDAARVPDPTQHGVDLPAGSVVQTPFSLVDLWALLAGSTGVASTPGKAPLTVAGLTAASDPAPIFADLATVGRLHRWALIADPWKLIVARDRTLALYDLETDPHEQTDRAVTEAARARELRSALAERNASCVAERKGAAPARIRPLSDERRERLRALGYLR